MGPNGYALTNKIFSKDVLQWRLAAIVNGMREAVIDRFEFFTSLLGSAMVPMILQLVLWHSVFKSSGATTFAGMSYPELLAYTWTSLLFTQVRGGNYDFGLIEMIRTGNLNNYLLRPVGVVEFVYFRGLGEKLLVALMCLTFGLIACLFTNLSPLNLLMGMSLAIMGNIIHYLMGATLAAAAFYWENAFAILMVKNMIISLLSGELLPLSLVPEQYAWVWKYVPFYLFVYGPTQVALGKWDHAEWALQMGIGFVWILVFWGLIKLSWGYSIKHYQGLGG